MTADASNQKKTMTTGTLLPTITLVFAGLTLLFGLFAMVSGSRMAAQTVEQMEAQKQAALSETTAQQEVQAALQEAHAQVEAEKKGAETLRKQLSSVKQELKKAKADLVKANQAIATFAAKAAAGAPTMPQTAVDSAAVPQTAPVRVPDEDAGAVTGNAPVQPQGASAPSPVVKATTLEERYIQPDPPAAKTPTPAGSDVDTTADSEPNVTDQPQSEQTAADSEATE